MKPKDIFIDERTVGSSFFNSEPLNKLPNHQVKDYEKERQRQLELDEYYYRQTAKQNAGITPFNRQFQLQKNQEEYEPNVSRINTPYNQLQRENALLNAVRFERQNHDQNRDFNWETLSYKPSSINVNFDNRQIADRVFANQLNQSLVNQRGVMGGTGQQLLNDLPLMVDNYTIAHEKPMMNFLLNKSAIIPSQNTQDRQDVQKILKRDPKYKITGRPKSTATQTESNQQMRSQNFAKETVYKGLKTDQQVTVGTVYKQAVKLLNTGHHKSAKELLDKAIRTYNYEDPALLMLCGETNLTLGYLIIAEQMFTKCLSKAGSEAKALKNLGNLASIQNDFERAIHFYRKSLEIESEWTVAYQIGLMISQQNDIQLALEYFCLAVNLATDQVLNIDAEALAQLYCARMKCYQQLGLVHHARQDYQKVLEADPNFIQKQMQHASQTI